MTTLIYRDGVLTGDRRYGMPLTGDNIVYVDRPKIHLHPSGKIAFGLCGQTKGKNVTQILGDYLLTVALLIDKGELPDMDKVLRDWVPNTLTIILMTRNHAWALMYEKNMPITFMDLDELPFYTVGSGQWCATALLVEDCPVAKIYEITTKIDGTTGPKFDTYKKTKLKALRTKRASRN